MKLKNYAIAVVAATLVACGESEIETPSLPLDEEKPTELETEAEAPLTHGMTVLGDKIPNAYTPENMREALVSLMAEDGGNKSLTISEDDIKAHHGWDRSDYNNTREKVKESWARGVEWVMAKSKYEDDAIWKSGDNKYTQVVRDLLDDRNLTKIGLSGKWHKKSAPCNISMANIEKALHGAKTWNAWRDNLDKIYPSKKKDIDEIFKIWEE